MSALRWILALSMRRRRRQVLPSCSACNDTQRCSACDGRGIVNGAACRSCEAGDCSHCYVPFVPPRPPGSMLAAVERAWRPRR